MKRLLLERPPKRLTKFSPSGARLSAELTFVSAATGQGSCGANGQVLTCALGELPVAGGATVVVNVNPNATGNVSSTASVTAGEPDHTQSNNGDSAATRSSASPSIRGA